MTILEKLEKGFRGMFDEGQNRIDLTAVIALIRMFKDEEKEQLRLHNVVGQSEQLFCGCGKNKPVTREPAYIHCDWCDRTYVETK